MSDSDICHNQTLPVVSDTGVVTWAGINYPYLTNTAMKHAADACHELGMQYSVYNTMRELSDRCTECLLCPIRVKMDMPKSLIQSGFIF